MSQRRGALFLVVALAVVLLAAYTRSSELRIALIVVAIVIITEGARAWSATVNRSTNHRVALSAIALLALLLAIYLPHLHFAGLIQSLYGGAAEGRDKVDATTWTRWALVAIAIALVVLTRRVYIVEITAAAIAALVMVAGAAATDDILSRLHEQEQGKKKTPAGFARGFVIPAAKVQPAARDLGQDSCVTIIMVKMIAAAAGKGPPTSVSARYSARLVAPLPADKPTAGVSVEIGRAHMAEQFARDLVAAQSIFFVSTTKAQKTSKPPTVPLDCSAT